ncbi:MAG: signal peptidase [Pseudomonadota bacterium]
MTELTETAAPDAKPAKQPVDWKAEFKGIFWLILAVLGFHTFVAKPFYIPSESMMPGLLQGDRLVVTKYAYGWSWVSPTFHVLPPLSGRLFGRMPERGDVVIVTPPGQKTDYIKRVIGLPGDRIEVNAGKLSINGVEVKRSPMTPKLIPIDANAPCGDARYVGLRVDTPGKSPACAMPVYRETLPNGRSYDTVDLGNTSEGDFYGPYTVPDDRVFLMGDNRDNSSDSRFSTEREGLGGAVPWENIGGRAEFISFSLDGSLEWLNPLTWFSSFRSGRAGTSLRPAIEPVKK